MQSSFGCYEVGLVRGYKLMQAISGSIIRIIGVAEVIVDDTNLSTGASFMKLALALLPEGSSSKFER